VSDLSRSSFGLPQPQGDGSPRSAESPLYTEDRATYPTPGEVIGQIARVIAVCLGLGLLARVLVAFTGIQ
jgi:hypothetical protein